MNPDELVSELERPFLHHSYTGEAWRDNDIAELLHEKLPEIRNMAAAIARVRELHWRSREACWCMECGGSEPWPCPTICALEGVES